MDTLLDQFDIHTRYSITAKYKNLHISRNASMLSPFRMVSRLSFDIFHERRKPLSCDIEKKPLSNFVKQSAQLSFIFIFTFIFIFIFIFIYSYSYSYSTLFYSWF